ncbi:hypothetical protein L3Q82_008436, partial [Scortum barcoo]
TTSSAFTFTRTSLSSPVRRYIHRGSRRTVHNGSSSTAIKSIWSTSRRHPRNTGRAANHSVLTSLARSANLPVKLNNSNVHFGLLNIRSLTNKGHLIQDLLTGPGTTSPVCQSRGTVPDLHAMLAEACQPRQPHNIQRLEVLRADLIHPQRLATEELTNYLSDFGLGDGRVHLRVPSLRFLSV